LQRYALFFLTPQTTVKQVVKSKGFILKRSGLGCYITKLTSSDATTYKKTFVLRWGMGGISLSRKRDTRKNRPYIELKTYLKSIVQKGIKK
jgi:hypothetical protein